MKFSLFRMVNDPGSFKPRILRNAHRGYVLVAENGKLFYSWNHNKPKDIYKRITKSTNIYVTHRMHVTLKHFDSFESFKSWFTSKYLIQLL